MEWFEVKRLIDRFLVEVPGAGKDERLPDVYNRFADYAAQRGLRIRNPENVARVFGYLAENGDVLWDERKRSSFVPMVEAERRYEKKIGII